jgi:protein-S-isoprenylcysteine O-methyltransferase Ste14
MQQGIQHYINAVWVLLGIYWAVELVFAKPAVKRQSARSSAAHLLLGCAAGFLVWHPATAIGFLGHRITSTAGWVPWLGLIATLCGCGLAVWARACLGSNWSALVTVKQGHELVVRGPYTVVRHPIYSGFLLALAGTAIAAGEVRAFIGLGLAFLAFFLKSAAEENFMREEFSGDYARYSQRVPRLIPFIL